jgi:hypothetical protein
MYVCIYVCISLISRDETNSHKTKLDDREMGYNNM